MQLKFHEETIKVRKMEVKNKKLKCNNLDEVISKEDFEKLIEQGEVIRIASSRGGIIYEVLKALEKNVLTVEALAEMLKVSRKTVLIAIAHLKHRHNKKIIKFYNLKDRKHYYYLSE